MFRRSPDTVFQCKMKQTSFLVKLMTIVVVVAAPFEIYMNKIGETEVQVFLENATFESAVETCKKWDMHLLTLKSFDDYYNSKVLADEYNLDAIWTIFEMEPSNSSRENNRKEDHSICYEYISDGELQGQLYAINCSHQRPFICQEDKATNSGEDEEEGETVFVLCKF